MHAVPNQTIPHVDLAQRQERDSPGVATRVLEGLDASHSTLQPTEELQRTAKRAQYVHQEDLPSSCPFDALELLCGGESFCEGQ